MLELELLSRPLTLKELQTALAKSALSTLKIKVATYSGLGVPGLYFTESTGGIHAEGVSGITGARTFGASVYHTLSKSKLASLAKLAGNL